MIKREIGKINVNFKNFNENNSKNEFEKYMKNFERRVRKIRNQMISHMIWESCDEK